MTNLKPPFSPFTIIQKNHFCPSLSRRHRHSSFTSSEGWRQHTVPDSRRELFWETLSKPLSQKATHGNHVYFFPLTSLHTHTLQRAHEQKWIHTKTHDNTLPHKRRQTTAASQGPTARTALLLHRGVPERSKVPLEEFQQGGQIRPNCAHWVFSPSWGNTASVTYSPGLSRVRLIHDLLILLTTKSEH